MGSEGPPMRLAESPMGLADPPTESAELRMGSAGPRRLCGAAGGVGEHFFLSGPDVYHPVVYIILPMSRRDLVAVSALFTRRFAALSSVGALFMEGAKGPVARTGGDGYVGRSASLAGRERIGV